MISATGAFAWTEQSIPVSSMPLGRSIWPFLGKLPVTAIYDDLLLLSLAMLVGAWTVNQQIYQCLLRDRCRSPVGAAGRLLNYTSFNP